MTAAVGLGLLFLSGCHDSGSPFGPLPVSPVGRYEFVGCTSGSDTVAAHLRTDCSYGGSGITHWDSGTLLLNEDRTVTQTFVTTFSAPYEPMPFSVTDTTVQAGRWLRDGRVIVVRWTNLGTAQSIYTRVDWDELREAVSGMYFWYRRTR